MEREEILKECRRNALLNAMDHNGKAIPGAVISRVMGIHPELRPNAKEVAELAAKVVKEINSLTPEEQLSRFEKEFGPVEEAKPKKRARSHGLPPLEGAVEGHVVMRFAPGPSGPLHIGHTRAAILNDEYVKRYSGRFILRIEDTNPAKIYPEAYRLIPEDLTYLGIEVHESYIQSDRFDIYYKWARKMLEGGYAYVCLCKPDKFRVTRMKGRACEHRALGVEWQLEQWDRMIHGDYGPGEASLVVKTSINHPNPALRDFVAFRILDDPHPRTGNRYHLYPLYNFSVSIDDHLMGVTHVLRGKDHLTNTIRQEHIYDYMGWEKPVFIHYGWVSIEDTVLKTSNIRDGISRGEYTGWDDPRLGTVRALVKRGIRPEAIRRYWREVGIKDVDINFTWDTLYAYNKEIIDPTARRYFFVWDPIELRIETPEPLEVNAPLHPEHKGWGKRHYTLNPEKDGSVYFMVVGGDFRGLSVGDMVRIKDTCNIVVKDIKPTAINAEYGGNDVSVIKRGVRIVHAVPASDALKAKVFMPDGRALEGYCETALEKELKGNDPIIVQFERFGFVNVFRNGDGAVVGYYAHG